MAANKKLLQKLGLIPKLPTLPQVVQLTLSTLGKSKSGARDVAEVITEDPVMTAEILRIANSVLHNPTTRKISSVRMAIARIGFDEIRKMVVAVSVIDLFRKTRIPFDYRVFWRHCIATGLIAQVVSEVSPVVSSGPDDEGMAFVGGLLHDIGILPLADHLGDRYGRMIRICNEDDIAIHELEAKRFGVTHAEVAGALIERWGLPTEVVMAAEHHHQPERARGHQTFVHIIHVADYLATLFGHGATSAETPCLPARREDIWCKLALDEADIRLIQPRFEQALEESALLDVLSQKEAEPEPEPDSA
ncbi:MAG: HDOD domain-containing protein [bacterium]|nr:HDOD domain-containing protein [bacterium]MCP5065550.1 HDOD domain-containing protein [bacterium]